MKLKHSSLLLSSLFLFGFVIYVFNKSETTIEKNKLSGAGLAMDAWSYQRSYPNNKISHQDYLSAYSKFLLDKNNKTNPLPNEWESLGPENIGGRTLCLAFHPTDENIIFAGSASGGLWKTTTQGVGRYAWEYIPTGFPVLGVNSIAINPNEPDTIYIGTGEVYGGGYAEPGTVNRFTRGSYGIGILKSTDGGTSWSHILEFDEDQLIGVQDLVISKQNTEEIFAATNIGVYRTLDGGVSWSLILAQPNCVDIEIDPLNNNTIYVTHGNLNYDNNTSLCGIYKSIDNGNSFNKLTGGLPSAWSGNAKITIDPTNSNVLYTSIQEYLNYNTFTSLGLYKSTDAGENWTRINNQNIAKYQGWYAHDIAINPLNPSDIMYVGVDAWKSSDMGNNFTQKSYWYNWDYDEIQVSIPEGSDDYVHADVHAVYYHPINNKVFMATDGGVFISDNGDVPYTTLNGGLQTTQFYADMGSSATNPNFCIGGTQDNASYIYKGEPSWWRVIGADGMSASVNQENDQIVYGSYYYLNIFRSDDTGISFINSSPTTSSENSAFNAPFILAPNNQDILYGGTTFLYKSLNGGSSWSHTSANQVDSGNVINKIAIASSNSNIVYLATTPTPITGNASNLPKILKTTNGGLSFIAMNGLPNRICTDIEIDPIDNSIIYLTYSGFGTNHIYKSIDAGINWSPIDSSLPDLPTNTILVDPLKHTDIYVGNDLGVYYSNNSGNSWSVFSEFLPEVTMVFDLNISPSNRKIRIATHGHGIFQNDFVFSAPASLESLEKTNNIFSLYPNPIKKAFTIENKGYKLKFEINLVLYNLKGQIIQKNTITNKKELIDISHLQKGLFLYAILDGNEIVQKGKLLKE